MPSGTRWLLLAGSSLLALAGCSDGTANAPSPAETSAGPSSGSDAARTEVVATSTPASGDARVATDTAAASTGEGDVNATGGAPSSVGAGAVTTSTFAATPDEPCPVVVALADAVAPAEVIDLTLPWPELQTRIAESSDAVAQSYLAVVPVAPADIDDDLRVLADYNTSLGELARGADSVTAFQAAVEAPDDALLAATAEVDGYMRDTCSIGLSAD